LTYRKSEKQVINEKMDEFWSTDKKVIGVHVDPPNINTARAV